MQVWARRGVQQTIKGGRGMPSLHHHNQRSVVGRGTAAPFAVAAASAGDDCGAAAPQPPSAASSGPPSKKSSPTSLSFGTDSKDSPFNELKLPVVMEGVSCGVVGGHVAFVRVCAADACAVEYPLLFTTIQTTI